MAPAAASAVGAYTVLFPIGILEPTVLIASAKGIIVGALTHPAGLGLDWLGRRSRSEQSGSLLGFADSVEDRIHEKSYERLGHLIPTKLVPLLMYAYTLPELAAAYFYDLSGDHPKRTRAATVERLKWLSKFVGGIRAKWDRGLPSYDDHYGVFVDKLARSYDEWPFLSERLRVARRLRRRCFLRLGKRKPPQWPEKRPTWPPDSLEDAIE
jgi:hypothetical protein